MIGPVVDITTRRRTHTMAHPSQQFLDEKNGRTERTAPALSRDWSAEITGLACALLVIVHTPHIRAYLEASDPKALAQAHAALEAVAAPVSPR
jgi:hypothetical protein